MKLPLAFSLKNRDATTSKDARILNGYVDIKGDPKKGGRVVTIKRPALDSAFVLTSGTGQALYVPELPDESGEPGVVIGDILTRGFASSNAAVNRLRFTVQPSDVALNTAISPAVKVSAINSLNQVATTYSGSVTLSFKNNPSGATLGGTVTQSAASGVATFSNLTLDRSGENFTLSATATGLRAAVSSPFTVQTELTFTVQPVWAGAGNTMAAVEVTVQDSDGATDTNYNGEITLSIYSATAAGVLSGTLTVAAVSGVASFTNLQIDTDGLYSLQAVGEPVETAATPARGISDTFGPYEMTAGQSTSGGSQTTGFVLASIGSISPSTFSGSAILQIATTFTLPEGPSTVYSNTFSLAGSHAQSLFTSLKVGSTQVLSADATYLNDGSATNWTWSGSGSASNLFPAVGSYLVSIV